MNVHVVTTHERKTGKFLAVSGVFDTLQGANYFIEDVGNLNLYYYAVHERTVQR